MEWLLAPIDPNRVHLVDFAVSWHGRAMVLAWGILAPLAVLAARFFKVLPWQDWPNELDSQVWWRSHWMGQGAVLLLTILGVGLVLSGATGESLHGRLGYAVLILLIAQVSLGLFRGSKGGPTAPGQDGSIRGDHYDMTPWRLMFEMVHKGLGYCLLVLAAITILFGLWQANAPKLFWFLLIVWWGGLVCTAIYLQRCGRAFDTYQAIWGPSSEHPGNRRHPNGWGMRRHIGSEAEHSSRD